MLAYLPFDKALILNTKSLGEDLKQAVGPLVVYLQAYTFFLS